MLRIFGDKVGEMGISAFIGLIDRAGTR